MRFERFVDSHTEGEPTRVLLGPDGGLFPVTLPEVLARLGSCIGVGAAPRIPDEWLALASHPRAADATVCALACRPSRPGATCGVLFWNASAPLGMCGHATIGLARTLAHLGHPLPSDALLETRVGDVRFRLLADGRVAFENVPARLHARDVEVVLEQGGVARGDVAWGGNWFYLVRLDGPKGRAMRAIPEEMDLAGSILRGIRRMDLRAGPKDGNPENGDPENGGLIDHVALVFQPDRIDARARNLVLCPNGTYDRSPCGTGTSALLASLAVRGELGEGERWMQESAIGSLFEARYARIAGDLARVVPTIAGRAFVTGEGRLVDDVNDPTRALGWKER